MPGKLMKLPPLRWKEKTKPPPKPPDKVKAKANVVSLKSIHPKVLQPSGAYSRFSFEVFCKNKSKRTEKTHCFAYNTAMAEEQSKSYAAIVGNTFVKVKKTSRVKWDDYRSSQKEPWFEKWKKEYAKYGPDNLTE